MTQAIPGYNALLQVTTIAGSTSGYTKIGQLTDVSLAATHESFDVTNHDGSGERERIGGLGDFSLDVSALFANDNRSQLQLFDAFAARRRLDIEHHPTGSTGIDDYWTGEAFVTKWQLTGSVADPAKVAVALSGSGPLTLVRAPFVSNLTTVQGNGTLITLAVPSGAVNGDLLIVFGAFDNSFAGLVADPDDFFLEIVNLMQGNAGDSFIHTRIVDGTEDANYTWTLGFAEEFVATMILVKNVNATFLDVSPITVNSLGPVAGKPVALSVTTVTDRALVFRATMMDAGGVTNLPFTPTGGETPHVEIEEAAEITLKVVSAIQAAAGPSGNFTFNPASTDQSDSYTVAIRTA